MLIFDNVIGRFRLRLSVGYFIYFKFTPVFFCWMFLIDVLYSRAVNHSEKGKLFKL